MKVACVQFAPKHRDIEWNLEFIRRTVEKTDAELLVFPELALTGYLFTKPSDLTPLAQRIDGALVKSLCEIARYNQKAIITGFLEEDNGQYYNSSIAIGNQGKLVGHYRKVHLFDLEKKIFTQGDLGFPVFDLDCSSGPVKVGMLVCYDWRFPEAARSVALQGAEIIAIPSNIVTKTGMLLTVLQTRAFENKAIVLFADRIGKEATAIFGKSIELEFRGESAIIDYNGSILTKAECDEEVITADVEPEKTRNKAFSDLNDIFLDRKPDEYL